MTSSPPHSLQAQPSLLSISIFIGYKKKLPDKNDMYLKKAISILTQNIVLMSLLFIPDVAASLSFLFFSLKNRVSFSFWKKKILVKRKSATANWEIQVRQTGWN